MAYPFDISLASLPDESRCVKHVRSRLEVIGTTHAISTRNLTIGFQLITGFGTYIRLKNSIDLNKSCVGIIAQTTGYGKDPVSNYLALQIENSACEIVQFSEDGDDFHLYFHGEQKGTLTERELGNSASFWEKLTHLQRNWSLSWNGSTFGSVCFRYQLGLKSRLTLRFSSGGECPIDLSVRSGRPERLLLVPYDTPEYPDSQAAICHLLTLVCLRFMVLALDSQVGS